MRRHEPSIVPQRLNPELTPELEREARFFQKWGYLVVDDAITPEQVEILREALDETSARGTPGPTGTMTHELLEEDDRFAFLLDNPPVLTRMKAILGNAVQLHSATGRVTKPAPPTRTGTATGPGPRTPTAPPSARSPGRSTAATTSTS